MKDSIPLTSSSWLNDGVADNKTLKSARMDLQCLSIGVSYLVHLIENQSVDLAF